MIYFQRNKSPLLVCTRSLKPKAIRFSELNLVYLVSKNVYKNVNYKANTSRREEWLPTNFSYKKTSFSHRAT